MIVKMQRYRSYLLPPEFWGALMQVRQYLFESEEFVEKVYGHTERDELLRSAFCLVDCVVDASADQDWMNNAKH
jgi:hypothetical protein